MKTVGISVYPDFYDIKSLKEYILLAKSKGFERVFTCMQLGDYGFNKGLKSTDPIYKELFQFCHEHGMIMTADVTDKVINDYQASVDNLKPFADMHLPILRIDGGFSVDQMIEMTRNPYGIKIEINASFITSTHPLLNRQAIDLLERIKYEGNTSNLLACFNFYPRIETGHDLESMIDSIELLKKYKISIGGFVASQLSKKDLQSNGNGIMTLESHRYLKPELAAQELFALGLDTVYVGDSRAHEIELSALGRIPKLDYLEIPIFFNDFVTEVVKEKIRLTLFKSREDQPKGAIRFQQLKGLGIEPLYCAPRKKYSITIDNKTNFRYKGEIQIMCEDQGRNEAINVIGSVHPDGYHLLPYIKQGLHSFHLVD